MATFSATVEREIRPRQGWASLDLQAVWEYRELLYFLVWRDVKVRYKQTVLGIAWAIIQPLIAMVVFTLIFGGFARMPSDGLPYPIFAYVALLPWLFFSSAIDRSSASVVGNAGLITKVYFPRLIIPLSAVLACFVDFGFAAVVLFALMAYYQVAFTLTLLWSVPLMVLCGILAVSVGLWLSAVNVKYRDVRYAVPFLLQVWMYATPIVYPSSLIPDQWRTFFALNPMVGVIDGFRWSLLGIGSPPAWALLPSVLVIFVIFVSAVQYFNQTERGFADAI